MPLDVIFITAGNYRIEDDGIPGNNISVIRDGTGAIVFSFVHPVDSLSFTATIPGVNITVNFSESLGAADFRIGSLTNPAETPASIVMENVQTTGDVVLVSNGTITEGANSDFASDIVAGTLILSAQAGIGTGANAVETQVTILEAETSIGGINIANFGTLQIGFLTDLVDGLNVATSGDLILTNVGSIFLSEDDLDPGNPPPGALETIHGGSVSGNVTLIATGFTSDIIANVNTDAITAQNGNITLQAGRDIAFGTIGLDSDNDVRANGTVTAIAGRDFIIDGFADLNSDGFGNNTGGGVLISVGRNIHMRNVGGNDASIVASGTAGADVTFVTGFNGAVILDAPTSVAVQSQSGDVTINADRMLINAASGITASSGLVSLAPATAGRGVTLGSAGDAAFALELSDAELDRIFTPNLIVGSSSAGRVNVIAPVSPASAPNLELRSGTNITVSASMTVTSSLTLRAADSVFVNPSTINVPTFSAFADQFGTDPGFGGTVNINALVASTTATLTGDGDNDTLVGTSANETIVGLGGNDTLRGFGGDDTLVGGLGIDAMFGGLGNDIYVIDNSADGIVEIAGEGAFDQVYTSVTYALVAGVAVEIFSADNVAATTAINLTGNSFGQTIQGNNGANSLVGGGGTDAFFGQGGNDTIVVDSADDSVTEGAGGGFDAVYTTVSYTLTAGQEIEALLTLVPSDTAALSLTGNALGQQIQGNAGNNGLNGGGGVDALVGLGGNDSYVVDSDDAVIEAVGQGFDAVYALQSYALQAGQEIEALLTFVPGGLGAINLAGNAFGQLIQGNAGPNTLTGGGGADTLQGLGGNDNYIVDSADDQVLEVAGQGVDSVLASVSYTLAAGQDIEALVTLVPTGTTAINLTGNAVGQLIQGNDGNNGLVGGGGVDVLQGRSGDDSYVVDSGDDLVIEAIGQGFDAVYVTTNYGLGEGQEIEALLTFNPAGATAISLAGNAFGQQIQGNAGANLIDGLGGADTLFGLGGADQFLFDTALGGGNVDTIGDFAPGVDKILLDDGTFTGLPLGALAAGAFRTGTSAQDADDRIIYDPATGNLFFDADGNGAGGQVQFATLTGAPALAASDFLVV